MGASEVVTILVICDLPNANRFFLKIQKLIKILDRLYCFRTSREYIAHALKHDIQLTLDEDYDKLTNKMEEYNQKNTKEAPQNYNNQKNCHCTQEASIDSFI